MTIRLDGKTAPFFIIAAGICWGVIGIFSRQLAALGFSPVQIAAVVLTVPEAAALFVLLGVVSTALPFGLYTLGLNKMEAGKASILASVEPLTSTLVGVAVFHEPLTAAGLGGIACILGAVVLLNCRS